MDYLSVRLAPSRLAVFAFASVLLLLAAASKGQEGQPKAAGAQSQTRESVTTAPAQYFIVPPFYYRKDTPGEEGGRRIFFLNTYFSRFGDTRTWKFLPLLSLKRQGEENYDFDFLWLVRASKDQSRRLWGFLPFWVKTRDGELSHFVVFPVFWKMPSSLTVFPIFWKYDGGFAVFPLYGQGQSQRPVVSFEEATIKQETSPANWRFFLWPLLGLGTGDDYSRIDVLWPLFQRLKDGDRESGWRLLPLGSLSSVRVAQRAKDEYLKGQARSALLLPLLATWTTEQGEIGKLDDQGGLESNPQGRYERTQRSGLLFLQWSRAYIKDANGSVAVDREGQALFPLHVAATDRLKEESGANLFLFLLGWRQKQNTHGWGLFFNLLANYERSPEESRFAVMWRLFEYSKDSEGQKRLRLFFSPRFSI